MAESNEHLLTSVSGIRKSRWGPRSDFARFSDLKLAITAPLTPEQVEAYARHVRILEITHTLKNNNNVSADHLHRSPSPGPVYDDSGRRTNTRYQRSKQRLEDERHSLALTTMQAIPNYRLPTDMHLSAGRRQVIRERLYIPSKDFPEINFIGQILGPRGRSLAEMNAASGANIVLRGKGSVKEGKNRGHEHSRRAFDDQQEPLHCLITSDTCESVDKAKELVQTIIEAAILTPEHENERKREQLRALAIVNGTFRDDERQERLVQGHSVTPGIVCRRCGGGHVARDCRDRPQSVTSTGKTPPWRQGRLNQLPESSVDANYRQLLAEIGETD